MIIAQRTAEFHQVYPVRVGSYGIALKNHKVLLVKNTYGYYLPGGGVESSETLAEGLKREVFEETGHKLIGLKKLGQASEFNYSKSKQCFQHKLGHFYSIEIETSQTGRPEADHTFGWYSLQKAMDLLTANFQKKFLKGHIHSGLNFFSYDL